MNLKLTDEQTEALTRELSQIVQNDRYALSPRIVTLKEILGMLQPEPARRAPLPPKVYAPPTKVRWPRVEKCSKPPGAYSIDSSGPSSFGSQLWLVLPTS